MLELVLVAAFAGLDGHLLVVLGRVYLVLRDVRVKPLWQLEHLFPPCTELANASGSTYSDVG